MIKESFHNLEKAQSEAEKIKGLVGEKGESEDYATAEKLLEEAGEIELVDFDAEESGGVEAQVEKTTPSIIPEKQKAETVKREPKPYAYKEIDRLGEQLSNFKKNARGARSKETRNANEEKIKFFREELEKAKIARKDINEKIENRNSKFERLLKDKFEDLKDGTWESSIPEIDSVQVYKDKPREEGKVESLGINVFWGKDGETHTAHFKLLKDGTLVGKMPIERGLNIDKDELFDDVLHTIETVDMSFFENISKKILRSKPSSDRHPHIDGVHTPTPEKPDEKRKPKDPRRLEFMGNHGKVLFGITEEGYNFNGYYGFVFPNFLVLENEKIGNAAIFIDFENPIDIDPKRFKLPPKRRMTKEERMKTLKDNIEKYINLDGDQLEKMGAERKPHPHMDNEKWEEKMRLRIDTRLTKIEN
ncbi:MAG: hypothetical protein AAB497_02490 [Patescibacteria group bacterium]